MTDFIDYEIVKVTKVIDGDTLDAIVRRPAGEIDGWSLTAQKEVRLRLVHLDTPERGAVDFDNARLELADWLNDADDFDGLRAAVLPKKDSFGRYLADVYEASDRSATASDFMVRHGNGGLGWDVWTR